MADVEYPRAPVPSFLFDPGGYGREELERAGACRVYADPAEMLSLLDEIGVRFGETAAE